MSDQPLLPPNASPQEFALEATTARISAVPVPMREIWNADNCPADLLPWLAWAFGCDEWSADWPEENKRKTIRESVSVQRKKGSVWSIRRALENAGYGAATLVEGIYGALYNGAQQHNGFIYYGDTTQWANYRIILDRPISNAQSLEVRRILKLTAPARCHLVEMIFTEASNLYNNAIRYDGTYNHGTA